MDDRWNMVITLQTSIQPPGSQTIAAWRGRKCQTVGFGKLQKSPDPLCNDARKVWEESFSEAVWPPDKAMKRRKPLDVSWGGAGGLTGNQSSSIQLLPSSSLHFFFTKPNPGVQSARTRAWVQLICSMFSQTWWILVVRCQKAAACDSAGYLAACLHKQEALKHADLRKYCHFVHVLMCLWLYCRLQHSLWWS